MPSRHSQKRGCSGNERTDRALFQMPAGIFIAIDAAMIALLAGAVLAAFVWWAHWKTPPDEKGPPHDPR
jgi:hypothetical protein